MKNSHLASCIAKLDYLKIVPSYRCDRGCSYCYNTALEQVTDANAGRLLSSLNAVLAIVQRPFVAEIIGGEPLQGDTASQTREILTLLRNTSLCEKTILSTAMGASRRLGDVLPLVDFLYFSVDITRAKENRKRISQRFLERLVDACHRNKTELCISVVLDGSESAGQLTSFLDCLLNCGVKNACFGFISFNVLERAQFKRYAIAFHTLFRAKCILGNALRVGGDILETLELQLSGQSRTHNCDCGETSVVVQPDGKVSPSICFEDSPRSAVSFGDYIDAKINRETELLQGLCGTCELWGPCQGGCMGAALNGSGRFGARDSSTCDILRSTWKLIKVDLTAA